MKIKEFRIPLHMSVDEYQIAQNWSVNEQSRRETGGGEGVEIRENKPFTGMSFLDGKYTSGQYTYKIYKVETKLPKFLRTIFRTVMGKGGLDLHEEAWNAYPYCKTVITNPNYMKDSFKVVIESLHLPDNGKSENVLGKDKKELDITVIDLLDVIKEKSNMTGAVDGNPVEYVSKRANRGPLDPNKWLDTTDPIMTCYKTVSIHCKWGIGLQNTLENFLMDKYRSTFLAFHQQIWCWTDEWFGMSMEELRELEDKTKEELKKKILEEEKQGTTNFD